MEDNKTIFVDSCVLLDVFNKDKKWGEWAVEKLNELSSEHQLVINTIVFTEVAMNFESFEKLRQTLLHLNIVVLDIPLESAFNVSRTFKKYRKNKGQKKSPMPDFYIGEHALSIGAALITRDTAKFRTYQPKLELIVPNAIH